MFGGGFGGYRPERVTRMPRWGDDAQRPSLFGREVGALPEWGQVASESDMFERNMAEMFFEHALTRKPGPADQRAFKALWQAMPEDGYSANMGDPELGKMWDRSLIYVATEFGRDKILPARRRPGVPATTSTTARS